MANEKTGSSYHDRQEDLYSLADAIVQKGRAEGKSDDQLVKDLAPLVMERSGVRAALRKAMNHPSNSASAGVEILGSGRLPSGYSDVSTQIAGANARDKVPLRPGSPGDRARKEREARDAEITRRVQKGLARGRFDRHDQEPAA